MKFGKEKKEQYVAMEVEMSEDEVHRLSEYARTHIVEDVPALLNYSVNRLLKEYVDALQQKNDILKGIVVKRKTKKSKETK